MTTDNTRAESPTREEDTLAQLANRLRIHNKWRRGDEDLPPTDPTQLGLDIDAAVEAIERVAAQAAEIERRRSGYRARHDEDAATIADLRAKLAEAERVLSKLPVDAEGKRVMPNGSPVVLYDFNGNPGHLYYDPATGWIVWQLCETACLDVGMEMPKDTSTASWPKAPDNCYYTATAARAAAEKGTEVQDG